MYNAYIKNIWYIKILNTLMYYTLSISIYTHIDEIQQYYLNCHFGGKIANSRYSHTLSAYLVSRGLESVDEVKLAETRTAITVAIPENRGSLSHDCYLHVLFIDCLVVSRQPATYVVGPKARLAVIATERRGVTECTLRACFRRIKFQKGLNLNV